MPYIHTHRHTKTHEERARYREIIFHHHMLQRTVRVLADTRAGPTTQSNIVYRGRRGWRWRSVVVLRNGTQVKWIPFSHTLTV